MPYLSFASHALPSTIFGRDFRFQTPDFSYGLAGKWENDLFVAMSDDSERDAFLRVPLDVLTRMMRGWTEIDEPNVLRFANQNRQMLGKLVCDLNTPSYFDGKVDFEKPGATEAVELPDGRTVTVYHFPSLA
jgi:hypothetical protein